MSSGNISLCGDICQYNGIKYCVVFSSPIYITSENPWFDLGFRDSIFPIASYLLALYRLFGITSPYCPRPIDRARYNTSVRVEIRFRLSIYPPPPNLGMPYYYWYRYCLIRPPQLRLSEESRQMKLPLNKKAI